MGGVDIIQLREKNLDFDSFLASAIKIKKLTEKYHVPLIINDNIDVCLQSGADGIHLGQGDMPLQGARKILGKDKIIGITAKTIQQAKDAQLNGADYIGVGAMFGSTTKKDAIPLSFEQLAEIRDSVEIPIVAIGGITADNVYKFKNTHVDGIAVVSAIFGQDDIKSATENLLKSVSSI
jgi:thiamine-phosphate diphosphorylase